MSSQTESKATQENQEQTVSIGRLVLLLLFLLMIPGSYILGLHQEISQALAPQIGVERPWVLIFLWALPALILLLGLRRRSRSAQLAPFVSHHLQARLKPSVSNERRRFKSVLFSFALAFFLIGWAGPQWGTHVRILKRAGIDVIVAIDVSESMLAKDMPTASPTRKQRRLALARRKVRNLMEMLDGERIGILAFSGQSVMLCPLTVDYNTCAVWLNSFSPDLIPSSGTALASTIRKAIPMFSTSGHNSRALFMITDGDDHEKDTKKAAKEAKKKGIRIYTLGIGSTEATRVDPKDLPPPPKGEEEDPRPIITKLNAKLLKSISKITSGQYQHAGLGSRDIRGLYQHAREKLKARTNQSKRQVFREARFPFFIGFGLFLLLLEFAFRERRAK